MPRRAGEVRAFLGLESGLWGEPVIDEALELSHAVHLELFVFQGTYSWLCQHLYCLGSGIFEYTKPGREMGSMQMTKGLNCIRGV